MVLSVSLDLVCLAPEPECEMARALHLGADLAAILNFDDGLPEGIRRRPAALLESAESVLSFTRDWCLKRNATFYAIVINGTTAIGSISLGRIDPETRSARIGYWLGSPHHGRGYGTEALAKLIAVARERGFRRLSATIRAENEPSKRMWAKLGALIQCVGVNAIATIDIS